MPYDPYGEDERRDSRYMDDDEYRRMRKAEDDEYEYHGDAADKEKEIVIDVDNDYPDPIEHTGVEKNKPDIIYEKRGKRRCDAYIAHQQSSLASAFLCIARGIGIEATDITYLFFKNGKCYLSTNLDAFTHEVLSYRVSLS